MKKLIFSLVILLGLIGCGKNEPLTQLKEGSHLLVEKTGDFIETVGQAPRIIGNKLLGTSEDTDEEVSDLQLEVNQLEQDLINSNFELIMELNDLKLYNSEENDLQMIQLIDNLHTELLIQINNVSSISEIVDLQNQIDDLRNIITDIDDYEVICTYQRNSNIVTGCELQDIN